MSTAEGNGTALAPRVGLCPSDMLQTVTPGWCLEFEVLRGIIRVELPKLPV